MNTHGRWSLAVLLVTATLGAAGATERKAIVTADRVNVRGQATLNSEIVTQLREGEEVLVIEEIPVKNRQGGEPSAWVRIQLPANTPVWVFAPYVEPNTGAVNVSRLNLRAGPGENYSVLGRVERGATVKSIRVEKNWMEIEAPPGAHAFVAADFLKTVPDAAAATDVATAPGAESPIPATPPTTPADAAATDAASTSPTDTTPVTSQPVEIEPAPVAPVDQTDTTAATSSAATPPTTTPPADPATATEVAPRRVVSREGRVIISRSIQAPTDYALESLDTRRTINYLHSEDLGVNLKVYAGRKVIVEGEELMDKRWTRTPIIEVERIRLVP
jgi:uncharacterized protein YgiM (DUF1202 family)